MKLSDLRKLLIDYAGLLESAGAKESARVVSRFAGLWPAKSQLKLVDVIPHLEAELVAETSQTRAETVEPIAKVFAALVPLATRLTTASKMAPLRKLRQLLEDMAGMDLRAFEAGLNEVVGEPDDLVAYYVARLDERYKEREAFKRLFERLTADKRVKKAQAKTIAARFANLTRANTRDEALQSIWDKHRYYVEAAQSGKSMGGKSAA